MKRFHATTLGWRGGALVGALLLAVALAGPAAAKNTNLTATAKYSASSEWQSDQGNTTFVAAKAFDGDLTTRWNVASGDSDGSWIAANWDSPVTINKVVVRQAFNRLAGFRVQQLDASNNWTDAYVAEDAGYAAVVGGDPNNPTFTIRLAKPITTKGLQILFTQTTSSPSIFEVEAWNNPAGTVTGKVTDASGNPIAGATVRAGGDQATTDAQGNYSLSTDAGTFNVTAGKAGAFRDRIARAIEIPASGSATHDFVLLPIPTNLSLSATAVSSSDWEDGTDYDAPKAKDGLLSTRWNSRADDAAGSYLEMQWAQAQTFNKVTVREAFDRIRNYSLQTYDEAGAKYVSVVTASVPTRGGDQTLVNILPQPVTSKRLRLLINDTDSTSLSVYELEVANAPVATANVVVKDAAGNPVPKATITSDLGVVLGTTDDKGELPLLVEPDDYVLTASADGYFSGAPVAFTINAGETQQITLGAVPTGPNIAKTAKASASSESDASSAAALAIDGDPDTYWLALDTTNQWIGVTFDKPTHFTVVQLRGFHATIQRSFLQILADDGTTWVDVPDTVINPEFLAIAGKPADFFFPQGITSKGVRYYIDATNSATDPPGLSEFLVYDAPLTKP